MNKFPTILSGILISIIFSVLLIVVYHQLFPPTKQAYLINSELFENFKGTQILKNELASLKEAHSKTLDSLQISSGYTEETYQRAVQIFNNEELNLSQRYSSEIWKVLNDYVSDYAKEFNYEFIFGANGSGVLMHANKDNDVTESVIEYANQKYEGN